MIEDIAQEKGENLFKFEAKGGGDEDSDIEENTSRAVITESWTVEKLYCNTKSNGLTNYETIKNYKCCNITNRPNCC